MKQKLFPETPLVIVTWIDASMSTGDEVDPSDLHSLARFGSTLITEEPGYLTRIDSTGVYCGLSKWPTMKKVGRSNAIPLEMVTLVKGVDETIYYEKRIRNGKKKPQRIVGEAQGGQGNA